MINALFLLNESGYIVILYRFKPFYKSHKKTTDETVAYVYSPQVPKLSFMVHRADDITVWDLDADNRTELSGL